MVNLGIDFGSTYTMVSVFRNGKVELVCPTSVNYNFPSIVAYDNEDKEFYYAHEARNCIGKKNYTIFRGFKMLLNEQMDKENLKKRGYELYSPEYITKKFLEHVIEITLERIGEEKVDNLVVGAPVCWFQDVRTVDAKSVLKSICSKLDKVKNVRIVSEPTSAAAYNVWESNSSISFVDRPILVIDYGGGTLDTALVSVQKLENGFQLKPEMRSGAGENCEHKIGNAGIAFQEALLRKAIIENGNIDEKELLNDSEFNKALKDLEEKLLLNTQNIKKTFKKYAFSRDELDNIKFAKIEYGDDKITITYGMMESCYNDEIEPVLEKVLNNTIDHKKNNKNKPYIAMVGGFCNFYLVEKQIIEHLNFSETELDECLLQTSKDESVREKAISFGTALLAADAVMLCTISEYSLGIYAKYPNGTLFDCYAINIGQEIKPYTYYFAVDENGFPFPVVAAKLDMFLLNFTNCKDDAICMKPREHYARKLSSIKCSPVVVVGFSVDSDENITVHIFNYDTIEQKIPDKPTASVQLSTFRGTFESFVLKNRR